MISAEEREELRRFHCKGETGVCMFCRVRFGGYWQQAAWPCLEWRLLDALEAAEGALRKVEWADIGGICLGCGSTFTEGHSGDCYIGKAIEGTTP